MMHKKATKFGRPQIEKEKTAHEDVHLFHYPYWLGVERNGVFETDARGGAFEVYSQLDLSLCGMAFQAAQGSITYRKRGALVGLHYQLPPEGLPPEERQKLLQGKLLTVLYGRILDVVIDLRTGTPDNPNPHFGHTQTFLLGADPTNDTYDDRGALNHTMIYIPPGFAHGFLSVPDDDHTMKGYDGPVSQVIYMLDNAFDVNNQPGILWNDPELNIDWCLKDFGLSEDDLIMSKKDRANMTLAEAKEGNMLPL